MFYLLGYISIHARYQDSINSFFSGFLIGFIYLHKTMKEELEWVLSLQRMKPESKDRFLRLHREIFGTAIDPCMSCPDQIRHSIDRLKAYYEKNYK